MNTSRIAVYTAFASIFIGLFALQVGIQALTKTPADSIFGSYHEASSAHADSQRAMLLASIKR